MKKIFTLLALAFCLNGKAQTYVAIPDSNFVHYLKTIVSSAFKGDSLNTASTLVTTTTYTIIVNNLNIKNLSGIQYFTSLIEFKCSNNTLVHLPNLPNSIQYLECANDSLLSISNLPTSLLSLICINNYLTALPSLPNSIQTIWCFNNKLTTLPLLPNSLQTLECYSNSIFCFPIFPSSITSLALGSNPFNCLPNYIPAMGSDTVTYPLCGAGNSNGCSIAPEICMVTTDSTSTYNYNIVYWNNANYNNVDSFIIYRYDGVSNNYLPIGTVSKSVSQFKDTSFSIGGPNGGNPLYASWKYKLAIRDTLGNIGSKSPFHQTMFIQQNNANFSWNAYTVGSGQTNSVNAYSFLRDDNNTGNWHVLVNTSITASTDPNYASYPNGNWRVDALGFNCYNFTKSHSNTSKQAAVGIEQYANNKEQISVYPNPNNGLFVIETNAVSKQTLQVYDVSGKMVLSQSLTPTLRQAQGARETFTIDASSLTEGVYTISLISNEGVINKKLVIVR